MISFTFIIDWLKKFFSWPNGLEFNAKNLVAEIIENAQILGILVFAILVVSLIIKRAVLIILEALKVVFFMINSIVDLCLKIIGAIFG